MKEKVLGGANFGDAVNAWQFVSTYKNSIKEWDSPGVATIKAAADFAWGEIFYGGLSSALSNAGIPGIVALPLSFGLGIVANSGIKLMVEGGKHTTDTMGKAYSSAGGIGSGTFNLTEPGYTMRQRSLQAIKSSGTNNVFGNEARTYFRDNY